MWLLGEGDCLYSGEAVSLGAVFVGGCVLLVLNGCSQGLCFELSL